MVVPQVVIGSAATGYRRTVIDTTPGAVLPAWIVALEIPLDDQGTTLTQYVDTGAPGGSYQPDRPQYLPDLVSNVAPATTSSSWLVALLAIGAGLWFLLTNAERRPQWQ